MFEVANGVENEYTIYANYIHTIDMYIRIVFIFLPKIRQIRSSKRIRFPVWNHRNNTFYGLMIGDSFENYTSDKKSDREF